MEIENQHNQMCGAARWSAIIGGSAAVWFGMRRKSLAGSALALAGAGYVLRGITGEKKLLESVGLTRNGGTSSEHGIKIRRSVTINRSREELYRFWRNFENLPHFMRHLESVHVIDNMHSHWVARAPAGQTVEWDAELLAERENELVGWRSLSGKIDHAGSVRFEDAPGGRGTVVRVQFQYNPPGGRIGAGIAKLFGETPDQQVSDDLYRLKQLMETGQISTTEGQTSGRAAKVRAHEFGERPYRESIRRAEPVETASEESFPASDAPSYTSGGGSGD